MIVPTKKLQFTTDDLCVEVDIAQEFLKNGIHWPLVGFEPATTGVGALCAIHYTTREPQHTTPITHTKECWKHELPEDALVWGLLATITGRMIWDRVTADTSCHLQWAAIDT